MDMDSDSAISRFCETTGADPEVARAFLQSSHGNIEQAVETYLATFDADSVSVDDEASQQHSHSGLAPGPESSGVPFSSSSGNPSNQPSSSRVKPPSEKKKFGSLRDLKRSEEENEKEDESDKEQEFFTGGDKSGLAVQDPNHAPARSPRDQIQQLLRTARQHSDRHPPGRQEEPARPSHFTGTGQTLGGDDTPSQTIPDPNASQPAPGRLRMVERTLHLWQDGFSVDDGPLYSFEERANHRYLDMIIQGNAPLAIMNVVPGDSVDVKVEQHRNEKFTQPKKKHKPFEGEGQRLGSPTAEIGGAASTSTVPATDSAAAPQAPNTSSSTNHTSTSVQLDPSATALSLMIRLADGTRLPSRFNNTHTVGEVYDFVDRSSTAAADRPYTLATTFPTRELTDKAAVLGDTELKKGGVVVQKWT